MKFLAPDNMNSVSVNGATFAVKDGIVILPDNLTPRQVDDLTSHGLQEIAAGDNVAEAKNRMAEDRKDKGAKMAIAEQAMRLFGIVLDRRKSLAAMQLEYDDIARRAAQLSQRAS